MRLADRTIHYQESVIREMTRLAMESDAINLSQGYPDFDPPQEVISAAINAIRSGYNQYSPTWGINELRIELANLYSDKLGWEVTAEDNVTITCGVTEAINVAMLSVLNPGDEIIIIEPAHENFVPSAILAGALPVSVPLFGPNFDLDADRIRSMINDRTKAIMINTPHNPTGKVFEEEELLEIRDIVVENDLVLITDEIYDRILYDGRKHICPGSIQGLHDRTITLGGMSKTFAITGWRLGYVVASSELMSTMRPIHDYLTVCAPTPLQKAAVKAMQLPNQYYDEMLKAYHLRRKKMMSILFEIGFVAEFPQGAYYVLAEYSNLDSECSKLDSLSFAVWLTKEVGVAVVPGEVFYPISKHGKTMVRFAFPKKQNTLDDAYDRMRNKLI